MSLVQVSENRIGFKESLNKAQIKFFLKAILIAGIGFALICGIGFLFYYALEQGWIDYQTFDTIYIIAGVSLLVQFIVTMIVSFMKKPNIFMIGLMFTIYIFSFGIFFSSIFFLFNGASLLMLFGISAGVLLICALVGSLMSKKAGLTLFKIIMIMMPIYFIFSLTLSLISILVFNYEWMYMLYTILGAVIILLMNVFSFYSLTKTSEFVAMNEEMDEKQANCLCLLSGFNIMATITNTVMLVARLLLLIRR